MEQVWLAGDDNNESCEKSEGSDSDSYAASSEVLGSFMDKLVLWFVEAITIGIPP